MSENYVECPICEAQLQLPGDALGLFRCPFCQRTFDAAGAIRLDFGTGSAEPMPVLEPAARPSLESQVSFDKNAPITLTPAGQPPGDDKNRLSVDTQATILGAEIKRRKRRQGRWFVGSALILMGLIGISGGLFFSKLNPPSTDTPAGRGSAAQVVESVPADDETERTPAGQSPLELAGEVETPYVVPPRPKFFFWSKDNADEVWKNTRPHLLQLEIEDPQGKSSATGILIDSRGWVLTSYHAIAEAWRIEVSAATAPMDEPQSAKPLRDLVRGIVATDPKRDLAILSVNRRFVVSFTDIDVTTGNRIVQGQFLVQCGPPSLKNYYGIAEVKIENRCETDELEPAAKTKALALELADAENTWLTFSGGQGVDPGTPLFDREGILQAMTSFTRQDLGYALPVNGLHQLVRSATAELQPLKTPIVRMETGHPVLLTTNSPARVLVAELNRAATACQQFEWLAADAAQYAELQSFAGTMTEAMQFVNDRSTQENESVEAQAAREFVQDAVNQWEQILGLRIQKTIEVDPTSIDQLNRIAAAEIKKGDRKLILFFGSLRVGGMEAPRLILKFAKSELYVSVPFDPEGPVLRPGTNWLFCLQAPQLPEPKRNKLPDGNTVTTQAATILFAIGPIEKF